MIKIVVKVRDKVMFMVRIKVRVRAGIHGWNVCYCQERHSVRLHPQSGAYHRDAEGYLSRSCGTPQDVTNCRYVTCWELEQSPHSCNLRAWLPCERPTCQQTLANHLPSGTELVTLK